MQTTRLAVALDYSHAGDAWKLVDTILHKVSPPVIWKIGPILLADRGGGELLHSLLGYGEEVFLDLKLNDVPRTVNAVVTRAADDGVRCLTVSGHFRSVVEAAVEAAMGSQLRVFAVPCLSHSDWNGSRAINALNCGVHGLVGGLHGLRWMEGYSERMRGRDRIAVGISDQHSKEKVDYRDHRATMLPREAHDMGATITVVGRAIAQAEDPRAAAERFLADLSPAPHS